MKTMDQGHQNLLMDLESLLVEARAFKFHDFKTPDAVPKINLVHVLQDMIEKAKNGSYDN